MKPTRRDFYNYLVDKCCFSKDCRSWICFGDLTFVAEFCIENDIVFEQAKEFCNDRGGFCDCEVIFNAFNGVWEK